MQTSVIATFFISLLASGQLFAAGLDELSKKPEPAPATNKVTTPSTPKAETPKQVAPATAKPAGASKPAKQTAEDQEESEQTQEAAPTEKVAAKPMARSGASKTVENRLSVGTSLGWSVVKPSKGTWIGIGATDMFFRWKTANTDDHPLAATLRYAPLTGVWNTGNRDYDVTLHGIFAGADYLLPLRAAANLSVKAGAELGYLLPYAKAQDGAPESSDVKKGSLSFAVSSGADWSLMNNKLKVGPVIRLQAIGFTVINLGGAAQFVF
jgi:hypothetical protein